MKKKRAVVIPQEEEKKDIETLKKKHPLVKDVRCFVTGWFPEHMPQWMQEVEA